jgi:hypothetical protein
MERTVEELCNEAFRPGRAPRSDEYKAGMRAGLNLKAKKIKITCPYIEGTVQFDAYQAGVQEGKLIYVLYHRREIE